MYGVFWFNLSPSRIDVMQSITTPIKDWSKIAYTAPLECQIGNICSLDTCVVTFYKMP